MNIASGGQSIGVSRYFSYHYGGFRILPRDCQVFIMGDIDTYRFQGAQFSIRTLLPGKMHLKDLWSLCSMQETHEAKEISLPAAMNTNSSSNRKRITEPQTLPIRQRPKPRNDGTDVQKNTKAGPKNVPSYGKEREHMPALYTFSNPGFFNSGPGLFTYSDGRYFDYPFRPGSSPHPGLTPFNPVPGTIRDEDPTPRSPSETQRGLRRRSSTTLNRQRASYETRPVHDLEDDLQETKFWASSKTRSPTPHPHPQPRATSTYARPASRDDFEIAFICALPIEKTAVQAMFDDDWDDVEGAKKYGTAQPDTNAYSHGRIGSYNVVVANIGGMGKRHAAAAAAHICHTWPKLQLILVVGICGAVPFPPWDIGEIILGDVVISSGVIQYDFGRRLDSGFVPKKEPQDLLPGPRSKVRPLLDKLRGVIDNRRLRDRLVRNLGRLEADADLKASYLGAKHDVLFRGDVRHIQDGMSCREAGCQGRVHRKRLVDYDGPRPSPAAHIGLVGSADTVMKSGSERDRIAMEDGVIAFEMEGAGVWGDTPCLVIKGVCDYADGHKMKKWQSHAAAAAAAGAAAFLDDW